MLTTTRGGNLQLSVREVGGTIRSLCNWARRSPSVKRVGERAGRYWTYLSDGASVFVRGRHRVTLCTLMTSVPPRSLSQLLVLALKVSSEFRWTMKTIPSSFPSYLLPEKQDVMDSTLELSKKGHSHSGYSGWPKTNFLNSTAVCTNQDGCKHSKKKSRNKHHTCWCSGFLPLSVSAVQNPMVDMLIIGPQTTSHFANIVLHRVLSVLLSWPLESNLSESSHYFIRTY